MFARDRPCSTLDTFEMSDDACSLGLLSRFKLYLRNFIMQITVVALHFI